MTHLCRPNNYLPDSARVYLIIFELFTLYNIRFPPHIQFYLILLEFYLNIFKFDAIFSPRSLDQHPDPVGHGAAVAQRAAFGQHPANVDAGAHGGRAAHQPDAERRDGAAAAAGAHDGVGGRRGAQQQPHEQPHGLRARDELGRQPGRARTAADRRTAHAVLSGRWGRGYRYAGEFEVYLILLQTYVKESVCIGVVLVQFT